MKLRYIVYLLLLTILGAAAWFAWNGLREPNREKMIAALRTVDTDEVLRAADAFARDTRGRGGNVPSFVLLKELFREAILLLNKLRGLTA